MPINIFLITELKKKNKNWDWEPQSKAPSEKQLDVEDAQTQAHWSAECCLQVWANTQSYELIIVNP